MNMDSWKRLGTKALLDHPRIKVMEDDVVLPDGHGTKYLRFENLQDWVTIVAVRDEKIAIIKDYSYPLDEWLWQLPEGLAEEGESMVEVAMRELREEAGLVSKNLQQIGMNYGDHRRSTRKNYVFLASDVREIDKSPGDPEEQGMELHWFSIDEVKRMIVSGALVQKNALSALAVCWARTDVNSLEFQH
jgi:8-oxo-dGTP pyrophosphatase MutT (NUDIX family)